MISELDVYKSFRSVQSSRMGKGYRIPKDWTKYFTENLNVNNQKILTRASKYFSTVWNSIDMDTYMECGFELFPKFSYHKFFDKKVMQLYIVRDKIAKNELMNIKKDIISSSKFVALYMKGKEYNELFNDYCRLYNNDMSVIVDHYIKNQVSSAFVCWMIAEGYFSVYDNDSEMMLPYVMKNYRNIYSKLEKCRQFLDNIKRKLDVQ